MRSRGEDASLLVRGAHLPAAVSVGRTGESRFQLGSQVDVRISGGRIVSIGPALEPRRHEELLQGTETVVIPGLHDHHLHLRSLVASNRSVAVGPAEVSSANEMAVVLAGAAVDANGWRRAVGYHESIAGELDMWTLDTLAPGPPLRVQHRTGAAWILNSSAADALGLADLDLPGIERNDLGRPTGRLFRMDEWLALPAAGRRPS